MVPWFHKSRPCFIFHAVFFISSHDARQKRKLTLWRFCRFHIPYTLGQNDVKMTRIRTIFCSNFNFWAKRRMRYITWFRDMLRGINSYTTSVKPRKPWGREEWLRPLCSNTSRAKENGREDSWVMRI